MSVLHIAITVEYTDPNGEAQCTQVAELKTNDEGSLKIPAIVAPLIAAGGVARIHVKSPAPPKSK